jgi:hypothetical protein
VGVIAIADRDIQASKLSAIPTAFPAVVPVTNSASNSSQRYTLEEKDDGGVDVHCIPQSVAANRFLVLDNFEEDIEILQDSSEVPDLEVFHDLDVFVDTLAVQYLLFKVS